MRRFKSILFTICILSFLLVFASCGKTKVICGEFGLKTPAENLPNVSTKPTLTWDTSKNAAKYELTIATNQALSENVKTFKDITVTQYTFTAALEYETVYFWSVKAISEDGDSVVNCIKNYSFTTEFAPLAAFNTTSPANNATDVALKPTLTWESVDAEAVYTLVLSRKQDFSGEPAYFDNILTNTYTIGSNLVRNFTYYWKVMAELNGQTSTTEVASFKTADVAIETFDNYDETTFAAIYQAKDGEHGQTIAASLESTAWNENGKSMKITGSNLADWGYLQVIGAFPQVDLSGYDGISLTIYPKIADERLGMIMHVVNGSYPNDCLAGIVIKGNAPSTVKIPFSALKLRAENKIGSFNKSYVTGLLFTFKTAGAADFNGTGFSGTYPSFEIYIDDIKGYSDSTLTAIDYDAKYTNEFSLTSIDTAKLKDNKIDVNFSKSGAGVDYSVIISENEDLSSPVLTTAVTAAAFTVVDGKLNSTKEIDISALQTGKKYYTAIKCGDYTTAVKFFEKSIKTTHLIDFEEYTDWQGIVDDCAGGVLNASKLGFSVTGGFNDSKALMVTGGADTETILKQFWDFPDFDYLEFFYNIPTGNADFFLRLYVSTAYTHRGYLDYDTAAVRLSGKGFLRIPINSTYLGLGQSATTDMITSANIKGFGIFVKTSSANFYIDNIKLMKAEALTNNLDLTAVATLRTGLSAITTGSGYRLVVQKSYTTSNNHKTLFPVVNKVFDTSADILTTELEDILKTGNYIYTVYAADGTISGSGKLTVA